MALFAITKGAEGDPVSARMIKPGGENDNEFPIEKPSKTDFEAHRLGPNDTIRKETVEEHTARTKKRTPGEKAQELLRSEGFERQLVKALATRFGISVSELIKEIRDA